MLLHAARDLGLKACYRFVGPSYDYANGVGDEYYHNGSAYIAGHVCAKIEIGSETYYFETQGRD